MADSKQFPFAGDSNVSTSINTTVQNEPQGKRNTTSAWNLVPSWLRSWIYVDTHGSHEDQQLFESIGSLGDAVKNACQEESKHTRAQDSLAEDISISPHRINNCVTKAVDLVPKGQVRMVVGAPPGQPTGCTAYNYREDPYPQAYNILPPSSPESELESEASLRATLQKYRLPSGDQARTITIPSSLHMTPICPPPFQPRPRIRIVTDAPPNLGPGPHPSYLFSTPGTTDNSTPAHPHQPLFPIVHLASEYDLSPSASPAISPTSFPSLRHAAGRRHTHSTHSTGLSPTGWMDGIHHCANPGKEMTLYPDPPATPRLRPINAWLVGLGEIPGNTTLEERYILSGPGTDEEEE